jgi:hypothetical protein
MRCINSKEDRMRRSTTLGAVLAGIAIVGSLAGLPSQAQRAPDPARLAAARELVDAMGGVSMAERVVDEMIGGMVNQMRAQNPGAAAEFERIMRTVLAPDSPRVKAYFSEIIDVTTQFYAEKFSVDELRELTAFQRSAVGQKFQKVVPEAMARMAPVMMKFQAGIVPDMQDAMRRATEQAGSSGRR